jgi:hypothetical protein
MILIDLKSPDEMVPLVHAALRAWYSTSGSDKGLLEGLLLVQERRRALENSTNPTAARLATNQVLLQGIEELGTGDQDGAMILKLRFADDNTLLMVAYKMNISEDSVSRKQRMAIVRLSNILYDQEVRARKVHTEWIEAQLPPSSYTHLIGVEEAIAQLSDRITEPGGPGVVAIVGIGGIGKTALADAVTRLVVGQLRFDGVVWLRSDPQTMSGQELSPLLTFENLVTDLAEWLGLGDTAGSRDQRLVQIRQILKDRPHLIVVDNLETDAATAYLLDYLNDLAGPSKFLLTTRARRASQATVFHFEMRELSLQNSIALVLRHAHDLGLPDLFQSDDELIRSIYDVTGGNPLALKLVVSLLDLLPLQQILSDLRKSRPGPIENLYKHIYWQAWKILSPEARSLLQAMPLVGELGGLPDYLESISTLPRDSFWPALQELRSRSLVEVRGSIQEKRYGIHRLTESFLRTEIIHWTDEEE